MTEGKEIYIQVLNKLRGRGAGIALTRDEAEDKYEVYLIVRTLATYEPVHTESWDESALDASVQKRLALLKGNKVIAIDVKNRGTHSKVAAILSIDEFMDRGKGCDVIQHLVYQTSHDYQCVYQI